MEPFVYFIVSALAGMVTSLSCSLGKMIGPDKKSQEKYPESGAIDNKISLKRVIWMVRWALQGFIGGSVIALIFVEMVRNGDLQVGWVFALSFIAGSVSWLDFKESLAAIKELLKISKLGK